MPLFEPSYYEMKKFKDALKEFRVIQRSEWLYEMELPMRSDMIPGVISVKEYNGKYAIRVELLYKKFPNIYFEADEFKQRGCEGHVYMDRPTHERWLKRFMDEEDRAMSTPQASPDFKGLEPSLRTSGHLITPQYPNEVQPEVRERHPAEAKVKVNLGSTRLARSAAFRDKPPRTAQSSSHSRDHSRQQSRDTHQSTQAHVVPEDNIIDEPMPEVVGGSGGDMTMELFTKEQMMSWSDKHLINRRGRLLKMQYRARRAGRYHQVDLCDRQLRLVDEVQQIKHCGRYAEQRTQSREASAEAKEKGVMPSLRRPVTYHSSKLRESAQQRHHAETQQRHGDKQASKPTRKSVDMDEPQHVSNIEKGITRTVVNENYSFTKILVNSSSDSYDLFPEEDNNVNNVSEMNLTHSLEVSVANNLCKRKVNRSVLSRKNKTITKKSTKSSKTFARTAKEPSITKFFPSNVKAPKQPNIRKTKPAPRSSRAVFNDSIPLVTISNEQPNESHFDETQEDVYSDQSPEFSTGSPNDPKIYLGGRYSDQTSPDSPNTAALINSKALWYEPCSRREYAYKLRAWKAEGRLGRPTNSPIGFFLPPSRKKIKQD